MRRLILTEAVVDSSSAAMLELVAECTDLSLAVVRFAVKPYRASAAGPAAEGAAADTARPVAVRSFDVLVETAVGLGDVPDRARVACPFVAYRRDPVVMSLR